MNQMLQDAPELNSSEVTDAPEAKGAPETVDRPPAPAHPRFAKPQRVAFVQSSWHREVVEQCRIAFLAEIEERNIERARIDLFEVPGSFEIPLHVQLLAKTRRYTAIVAAGLWVAYEKIPENQLQVALDVLDRTEAAPFSPLLHPLPF